MRHEPTNFQTRKKPGDTNPICQQGLQKIEPRGIAACCRRGKRRIARQVLAREKSRQGKVKENELQLSQRSLTASTLEFPRSTGLAKRTMCNLFKNMMLASYRRWPMSVPMRGHERLLASSVLGPSTADGLDAEEFLVER
ncbi:hypothetical protein FIBSPDRAFT_880882 [Athelia psychrophila]|uniref:Uncharacterized protein n=1 Tax=Athelia psychrophila TaxID=1759441 RepID=A0A166X1B4_9AGAM|nr:hypothetical protein FIBSPDRAFT_880882 [Fibularhizoctonia sp. CBS 109695]